jgi:ParB/RepB/Spo0J family partition protein
MQLLNIRLADIHLPSRADPGNPVDVLAESIRRDGVLRPVLLRPTSDGYEVVHGERRCRVARTLGFETVPAYLVQDFVQAEGIAA